MSLPGNGRLGWLLQAAKMLTPNVIFQQAPTKSLDIVRDKAEIIDLCQRNLLNEDQLLALSLDAQNRILMLVEMMRSAAEPPRRVTTPSNESVTPRGTEDTGTPADTIDVLGATGKNPDNQDDEHVLSVQKASDQTKAENDGPKRDTSTTVHKQNIGSPAEQIGSIAEVEATDASQRQSQEQSSSSKVRTAVDTQQKSD
jgi:hypothetical protein